MIKGDPKVTVIIPTSNQKNHLQDALESVLAQDHPHLEIVVGDDCSTDGTSRLIKQYASDPRLTYIENKENLGAGVNSMHLLVNHTRSRYAMLLDHDDYLTSKDFISRAVSLFLDHPELSIVRANTVVSHERLGRTRLEATPNLATLTPGLEYFLNYLHSAKYPYIRFNAAVFDLEKLNTTGYFAKQSICLEMTFFLHLMICGDVGYLPAYVSVYRIHSGSISYHIPSGWDQIIVKQLISLKEYVLSQKLAKANQMEKWFTRQLYNYTRWRYDMLRFTMKKRDALTELEFIKAYPYAYNRLVRSIK